MQILLLVVMRVGQESHVILKLVSRIAMVMENV
jgi:hypothetical protein